jgi:adenine-specific DNA methylase
MKQIYQFGGIFLVATSYATENITVATNLKLKCLNYNTNLIAWDSTKNKVSSQLVSS